MKQHQLYFLSAIIMLATNHATAGVFLMVMAFIFVFRDY